jgi:hypothetical protein
VEPRRLLILLGATLLPVLLLATTRSQGVERTEVRAGPAPARLATSCEVPQIAALPNPTGAAGVTLRFEGFAPDSAIAINVFDATGALPLASLTLNADSTCQALLVWPSPEPDAADLVAVRVRASGTRPDGVRLELATGLMTDRAAIPRLRDRSAPAPGSTGAGSPEPSCSGQDASGGCR